MRQTKETKIIKGACIQSKFTQFVFAPPLWSALGRAPVFLSFCKGFLQSRVLSPAKENRNLMNESTTIQTTRLQHLAYPVTVANRYRHCEHDSVTSHPPESLCKALRADHLCAWLSRSFTASARDRSGRSPAPRQQCCWHWRSDQANHRLIQHGSWLSFAWLTNRWPVQHCDGCWGTSFQHRRSKYSHGCCGARKQHQRFQQHGGRSVCAFSQLHWQPQYGCWCFGAPKQHDRDF